MIRTSNMLYLYTETPLHVGVGSGLSSIELPIQRERHTQYPLIPGSSIKGKLRALARRQAAAANQLSQQEVELLFGSEREAEPKMQAGALIFGDARLLLFPVRSLNGIFAYTTSRHILSRFAHDLQQSRGGQKLTNLLASLDGPTSPPPDLPTDQEPEALVTQQSSVTVSAKDRASSYVLLEEFSFKARLSETLTEIASWLREHALPLKDTPNDYWGEKLRTSLVLLPDDDFRDFTLHATEVITRVSLDQDTKTASERALWTEEHLPSDTLLYAPIYATDALNGRSPLQGSELLEKARKISSQMDSYLQLGGDETVGRGLVKILWDNVD